MKTLIRIGLIIMVAAISVGCQTIRGSGTIVEESRGVRDFHAIQLDGSGIVNVSLGDTEALTVSADDNIMGYIETTVSNGRLELTTRNNGTLIPSEPIIYTLTLIELDGIELNGSGQINITEIDTDELTVEISGSGDITVTGNVEELDIMLSGSGNFIEQGLESHSASVNVSGSGDVAVNVISDLNVSISGSGDVNYTGSPSVSQTVSGSGSIREMNN